MDATTAGLIAQEARRLGLKLAPATVDALARYVSLLARWAGRIRLTSRRDSDPRVLVERHLADALAAARFLGPQRGEAAPLVGREAVPLGREAADVGSGAGLPGLPLVLLRPEYRMHFIESNSRKCSFICTALGSLGLPGDVHCARLEQLTLPPLALACSRATWPPAEWLPRGLELVGPGGGVLVFAAREEALPRPPDAQWAYQLADGTPRVVAYYLKPGPAGVAKPGRGGTMAG